MSTIDEQIKCVERELGMRQRVYPSQVARGKMTKEQAQQQIQTMQDIRETLQALKSQIEPSLFRVPTDTLRDEDKELVERVADVWYESQGTRAGFSVLSPVIERAISERWNREL